MTLVGWLVSNAAELTLIPNSPNFDHAVLFVGEIGWLVGNKCLFYDDEGTFCTCCPKWWWINRTD